MCAGRGGGGGGLIKILCAINNPLAWMRKAATLSPPNRCCTYSDSDVEPPLVPRSTFRPSFSPFSLSFPDKLIDHFINLRKSATKRSQVKSAVFRSYMESWSIDFIGIHEHNCEKLFLKCILLII